MAYDRKKIFEQAKEKKRIIFVVIISVVSIEAMRLAFQPREGGQYYYHAQNI